MALSQLSLKYKKNIQISKTSKELLDRVGGFRCERRGIIDLPVSSFQTLRNIEGIVNVEKNLRYRKDMEITIYTAIFNPLF